METESTCAEILHDGLAGAGWVQVACISSAAGMYLSLFRAAARYHRVIRVRQNRDLARPAGTNQAVAFFSGLGCWAAGLLGHSRSPAFFALMDREKVHALGAIGSRIGPR